MKNYIVIGFLMFFTVMCAHNKPFWVLGKNINSQYYGMYILVDSEDLPLRNFFIRSKSPVTREGIILFPTKREAQKAKTDGKFKSHGSGKFTIVIVNKKTVYDYITNRMNNGDIINKNH